MELSAIIIAYLLILADYKIAERMTNDCKKKEEEKRAKMRNKVSRSDK